MKWAVNICLTIPETGGWDPTPALINDKMFDMDGIQDAWLVSKTLIKDSCYVLEFHVAAKEMPIAVKIMQQLKTNFEVSEVSVTRAIWNPKEDVPFQWTNEGVVCYADESTYHQDFWEFRIDGIAVFSVHYVPTYTKNWPDWRRQKFFGNAQFAWEGMSGGFTPLKATTIDEALKEFEDIYVNMTRASIQAAEKKLHDLNQELEDFLKWKEK